MLSIYKTIDVVIVQYCYMQFSTYGKWIGFGEHFAFVIINLNCISYLHGLAFSIYLNGVHQRQNLLW